ncbi:hypothetical protein ACA910_010574 [Epithemia clementina (nom. ined.)]
MDKDKFLVLKAGDLDDALMDKEDQGDVLDDPKRFKIAQDGDHLMCPFQCNNCLLYNVKEQFPADTDTRNRLFLICIHRANLDAFWSRESSTVGKNWSEMESFLQCSNMLGISSPLPVQGPHPVADTFGIATACAMLMKTLRAGRNTDQIQFETAQKVRLVISNFDHTTPYGVGATTISTGDRNFFFFLGSTTNRFWFCCFMTGCHCRMGHVWVLDRAVTLEQVLECLSILNKEFGMLGYGQRRLEVCLMAALIVIGYTAMLRGEEIPQVYIGMMQKYWSEGKTYTRKPHVPLTLVGRFKQTNGQTKTYIQPLAPITSSGIQVQLWLGQTLDEYNKLQVKRSQCSEQFRGKKGWCEER